jgi:hypothetical protein
MLAKKGLMTSPSAVALYVENVFSTTIYTGAGTSQTVTNNIDLASEGGMVWIKNRDAAVASRVYDTNRGAYKEIYTSAITLETDRTGITAGISSFNADGFSLGSNDYNGTNQSSVKYASWTFRKAEKFFDVVTYSGDSTSGRQIAHNLGSVPGVIIVKIISGAGNNWQVYHRSIGNTKYLQLNTVDTPSTATSRWNDTTPTSTYFVVGNNSSVNATGSNYVAYLFAHDAGGFGAAGSDNVISCGSYTGNGSSTGPTVTIGYEPQWLLVKRTDFDGSWRIYDSVRDNSNPRTYVLYSDLTDAEEPAAPGIDFNSTSFQPKSTSNDINGNGATYIYIAIRKNMN